MQFIEMLNYIILLGKSNLRIFCYHSYSIELFFILLENNIKELGIDEIYNKIILPKPKKSSVDSYIKILIDKDYVKTINNKDKPKKTLILTQKSLKIYKDLKIEK